MKFSGTQLSVLTAPSTSMIHDERGDPVSITEKQLDSAVELISPTSSPRSSTSDTINTPPLTSSDDDDVSLAEIKVRGRRDLKKKESVDTFMSIPMDEIDVEGGTTPSPASLLPINPEALIPPVWSTPADRVAPTPRVKQANWGDKIPPGWKLVPPAPPPKPVVTPPKPAVEEPVVPMKSWYELTRPQHAPPPKPEVEEPFSLFVLASLSYTFHPPLAPKPFDGPVSEKDWNVKGVERMEPTPFTSKRKYFGPSKPPVYVAPVNPIQNSPPLTQTPASPPVMVRDGPPLTHRNSSPPITQNSPSLSNHFAQTPTIIVSPPNSPPLYSSTPKSRFSPPTPPILGLTPTCPSPAACSPTPAPIPMIRTDCPYSPPSNVSPIPMIRTDRPHSPPTHISPIPNAQTQHQPLHHQRPLRRLRSSVKRSPEYLHEQACGFLELGLPHISLKFLPSQHDVRFALPDETYPEADNEVVDVRDGWILPAPPGYRISVAARRAGDVEVGRNDKCSATKGGVWECKGSRFLRRVGGKVFRVGDEEAFWRAAKPPLLPVKYMKGGKKAEMKKVEVEKTEEEKVEIEKKDEVFETVEFETKKEEVLSKLEVEKKEEVLSTVEIEHKEEEIISPMTPLSSSSSVSDITIVTPSSMPLIHAIPAKPIYGRKDGGHPFPDDERAWYTRIPVVGTLLWIAQKALLSA